MRTVIMTAIGFAVLSGFWLAGRALPSSSPLLLPVFATAWGAWCLYDTWVGTTHGYTWEAELLIHAPIFLLPVAAGWFLLNRPG